jgi:FKBP-type peptidyl-prolyl cis-trans isomerase FkpA
MPPANGPWPKGDEKLKTTILMLTVGMLLACQPQSQGQAPAALDTDELKTAYTLGFKLGENLKGLNLGEPELGALEAGLGDAAAGLEAQVDTAQFEPMVQQLAQKRASEAAESRRTEETAFLEKAAAEEGAERQASGLIIVRNKAGEGESPKSTSRVKVHYHGTFADGSVFDSSRQRGEPAVFPLNGVIPCWTEALQLIKVGGTARITCPATIAYGDRGAPPRIPPGATLVFDVELIEIIE